jgi:hypothetical protein
MTEYAYPDVLVSTAWVAEHGHDPNVRLAWIPTRLKVAKFIGNRGLEVQK